MRRLWAKIVVASLVILGEGALAFEICQRSDDRHASGGNHAAVSQEIILDDPGSSGNPSSACIDIVWPKAGLARHKIVVASVLSSAPFEYRPCNPRAPPVPAS